MAIQLEKVTKKFGKTTALDSVSAVFGGQKIYGLLGNNGAGKSTLLNLITDRCRPDEGRVTLDGESVKNNDAALGRVFLVGEQNFFPEGYAVRRAFRIAARMDAGFDADYAEALSQKFGLKTRQKIDALSTGYATIFRIILALASNADHLLLDEPVLGLDAQHRELFYRELMANYAKKPRTIVISTHLIAEVENLIEDAVILYEGKVLQAAPAADLLADAYTVSGPAAAVESYLKGRRVLAASGLGGLKTATVRGTPDELPQGLELGRPGLQDYFISLMESEAASKEGAR